MIKITKPSITRLARRGGVKSVSEDTFNVVHELIEEKLERIIRFALIANEQSNTKTLMPEDIYNGFQLDGENVSQSSELYLMSKK